MEHRTVFICNQKTIDTTVHPGTTVLDFLRNNLGLKGTKAACREGDCGSCTILVGRLQKELRYSAVTSCLLPLGDMAGKHVVTIEGLNPQIESTVSDIPLTPVQRIFANAGGSQCGFCTPGFINSLTYFLLRPGPLTMEAGLDAVSGNICRCTGYGAIKRAIGEIVETFGPKLSPELLFHERLQVLIQERVLPEYFIEILERLETLRSSADPGSEDGELIAGGTDLYVQKPESLPKVPVEFVSRFKLPEGITISGKVCRIGAGASMESVMESGELARLIPGFTGFCRLIASSQIRQRATLGGNIVNGSPIGDMSVFLLGIGADICLSEPEKIEAEKGLRGKKERCLPLADFFTGYKQNVLRDTEIVTAVEFHVPGENTYINFEKVSRRTHLDIASVNSAIRLEIETASGKSAPPVIKKAVLSAGGVAPVPLYLEKVCGVLEGKPLTTGTVQGGIDAAAREASPISDIRGSGQYKLLLLRQLIIAHFMKLFPDLFDEEGVYENLLRNTVSGGGE